MKLPHRERAYIPPEKLTGYLLSETHPDGRSKARFFRALGLVRTNADLLARHLLSIADRHDVQDVISSPFGTKYTVSGEIRAPSGTLVTLCTVWIIETGQDAPRFVTAYPS